MNPVQIVFQPAVGLVRGAVGLGLRTAGAAFQVAQRALSQDSGQADGGRPAAEADRGRPARRRSAPDGQPQRPKDLDDVTLARKVESEIFRGADSPKATVDVNVVDGVVWLRGQVRRPEQIRALEAQVAAIPEVKGVENLLHLPKTPAPTRADTPRRQQRTRSTTRRPQPRRTAGRLTDDRSTAGRKPAGAEPSPRELAEEGRGRPPAPLGGDEDSGNGSGASGDRS